MRIISQDGTIDVPYDLFSLSVASGKCKDVEYSCIYCYNISSPHGTKMAEYSSKEKAIKAVEMLRNANTEVSNFSADSSGFKSSVSSRKYFQFPKDDEVEV